MILGIAANISKSANMLIVNIQTVSPKTILKAHDSILDNIRNAIWHNQTTNIFTQIQNTTNAGALMKNNIIAAVCLVCVIR